MMPMIDADAWCVVLAAGEARRFDGMKVLATWQGETLVASAVRKAERASGERTLLVAGREWQRVVCAAAPQAGFYTVNGNFREGMASSIRCGVTALADVAAAIVILLADQPLVSAEHIDAMIARWRSNPDAIVATGYRGKRGAPCLFPARDFAALTSLSGDTGANEVLCKESNRVVTLPFEAAAIDVDTPDDLRRLPDSFVDAKDDANVD